MVKVGDNSARTFQTVSVVNRKLIGPSLVMVKVEDNSGRMFHRCQRNERTVVERKTFSQYANLDHRCEKSSHRHEQTLEKVAVVTNRCRVHLSKELLRVNMGVGTVKARNLSLSVVCASLLRRGDDKLKYIGTVVVASAQRKRQAKACRTVIASAQRGRQAKACRTVIASAQRGRQAKACRTFPLQ